MADKTKIKFETVKIYVAPAGEDTATPANWTEVGWCEGGKTVLTEKERSSIPLDDDSDYKVSVKYGLDAVSLETDLPKIQALEALEDQDLDVLLVKRSDLTTAYKLTNLGLAVVPDFNFTSKEPQRVNLNFTKSAAKLTDFFSEVTGLPAGY